MELIYSPNLPAKKLLPKALYNKYMLVFIDESGDPGLVKGASRFFTISLVVFEENEEGEACDKRIELLKRELSWNLKIELHF